MSMMASQITRLTIVYSTIYSGADGRNHQSSASLAFRWPVNSPHKGPVTRKMLPFDDVIMETVGCPIQVTVHNILIQGLDPITRPVAETACWSDEDEVKPGIEILQHKEPLIARFMGPTWGPIWGRQDPGGPHIGPMNLAIWGSNQKHRRVVILVIMFERYELSDL